VRRFFYSQSPDVELTSKPVSLSDLAIGTEIALTSAIFHHWIKVLRAAVGDEGALFDGFGGETIVKISHLDKKSAAVVILDHLNINRNSDIVTMIGLVMSRGERMDYAIQKATELGVTAIWLLSSQHGEVHLKSAQVDKKLAHWQQVAVAACEQCGLNRVPLIIAPMPITEWLQLPFGEDVILAPNKIAPVVADISMDEYYQPLVQSPTVKLVLSVPKADQPLLPKSLLDSLSLPKPYIQLLIGAEGGLSEEELTVAESCGFLPWQIGDRILRTETAPVVALATLNALKSLP